MKTSTRRRVFYPYQHLGRAGSLELVELRVDGTPVRAPRDGATLELQDIRIREDVALSLRYVLPDRLPSALPPDERDRPMCRVAAVAAEERTWLRSSTRLKPGADGAFVGELGFRIQDAREVVSVRAVVTRGTPRRPLPDIATERGAILCESPPLRLRLLEPSQVAGSFMNVRWRSFQEEPALRAWAGLPWYLQLTADPPVLWLNNDLPDLRQVLSSKAKRGRPALLRDLLFKAMASHAWTQLFHDAARGVQSQADGTWSYERSWHEHVLRQVAIHAFPAYPKRQRLEVLLARVDAAHRNGGEGLSLLEEEVVRGVARWMDLGRQFDRASRGLVG